MIKIISDSTCDLSNELLMKYNIGIIPLTVILGEDQYLDKYEITPEKIYRWSDQTKQSPKTAAMNPTQIVDYIRPFYEQADELILFSISSQMSSTANNMRLAADMFDQPENIHIIDSENLSTGIGLLIIEAAQLARQGKTAHEIIARIEELKPLVRSSFVVDTLTYLHRGGRCSSVSALAGSVLKIHPKIVVKDGAMAATKKYRGSISSAIKTYVEDLKPELEQADPSRVFITHSGCAESVVQEVRRMIDEMNLFDEIHITQAGSVVSSHCGPGTLGVLFIDHPERSKA